MNKMVEIEFPKVRDEINPKDYHIDGKPDGEYALRILKFYRELARTKWIVEGMDSKTELVYDAMNMHQDMRAEELDAAIAILMKVKWQRM